MTAPRRRPSPLTSVPEPLPVPVAAHIPVPVAAHSPVPIAVPTPEPIPDHNRGVPR